LLADRETKGSRHWLESRLTRDSFSLMPVATANRREPNKSRSSGSTSVKMNEPFSLLLPAASRDVVSVPISGMAVGCSVGSADEPGPPDWQVAAPECPTHRERKKRRTNRTNLLSNLTNTFDMGDVPRHEHLSMNIWTS